MAEEKPRIWISDNITLQYPEGIVGFIRGLSIPLQSPGPTDWTCAIVIDDKGECDINVLEGVRGPTIREVKQLVKYFTGLGYTGEWGRFKFGKPTKTISIK